MDVSAPGCTGATTLFKGGYGSFCGTSNSAPEVSGILMLMWSVNLSLTPDQVQDVLFRSAKDLGSTGWDQYYGWGRIDAQKAVSMILQGDVISTPSVTPPPGKVKHIPSRKN